MRRFKKIWEVIAFAGFYLSQLVIANIRIVRDVLTPGLDVKPGLVKIQLRTRNDLELLLFANLVSITPGTLLMDISQDKQFLYIHVLYSEHPDDVRKSVGEKLQMRVLGVLRW